MKKFHQIDGAKLKRIREEQGLSQAKLAELAKLSSQSISNIERNRGGAAGQRPDTITLLASALGVQENELLVISLTVDSTQDNRGRNDIDMSTQNMESLADFVQLSEAKDDPKTFVDDHFSENHKYIDKITDTFNRKDKKIYANLVSDLKGKNEKSLTSICNTALLHLRCMTARNDITGDFFKENSLFIIYDIGNALHRQLDRCHLTTHFDREMMITLVIQDAFKLSKNLPSAIDNDRLNSLILQIQKNRFITDENKRIQDLINLYFFICEKWYELHEHSSIYILLNDILCAIEDDDVEQDDLITRECIARIVFRMAFLWENLSHSIYRCDE